MILALIGVDFAGASAEAGFLRQGVRPGEAGKAVFLRPPPAGTPVSIRPPGAAARASNADATAKAAAPAQPRRGAAKANQEWFWAVNSPAASDDAAGRWADALAALQERRARGQGLVSLATIEKVRALWGPQIRAAAAAHNLSEALLLGVVAVESGGRPAAISDKGAQGLMQLIPATASRFGVADVFDPAANIEGGAAYLDWLLSEFRGDALLALAGYNAGENAVRKHDGVPPYAETRDYVVLVLDAVAAAGGLCDAPPAGPRLPCRWKTEI